MSEAYDKTVATEKAKFDQENAEILAKGEKEAEAIESAAEEKIREVSNFLTKAFERAIDVSS
jgi:vacuolar-type H+-ATPase subunit H